MPCFAPIGFSLSKVAQGRGGDNSGRLGLFKLWSGAEKTAGPSATRLRRFDRDDNAVGNQEAGAVAAGMSSNG